jgi:putative spermidine/putrescine transport system substrate-binding protein
VRGEGFVNRRSFLQAATISIGWASLGCVAEKRDASVSARRNLRVFVYAGGHDQTMRQVFVPAFEAITGEKVTLFPGWWDGVPKLKTAPVNDPPFDLMITDATQGYPAAKDDLFAKIDFENVPNHKTLVPESLDNWVFRDGVGLPYPDSVMTLAFGRKAVTDAPARWSDLLRSDFDNSLGFYSNFYMSLFTFAAMLADSTGNPGTAHEMLRKQPDEVFRFAHEQRRRIKLWWPTSTDMILALHDGQVKAGNMHSPELLQALREQPNLGAIVPDHDRAMVQVFWAIPAGTRNKDLAERALDVLFSNEVQYGFTQQGMATSRPDTAAKMAAEDPIWKNLYPHTSEQFRDLKYYPYDFYAENWDDFADRWDRTVLRDE